MSNVNDIYETIEYLDEDYLASDDHRADKKKAAERRKKTARNKRREFHKEAVGETWWSRRRVDERTQKTYNRVFVPRHIEATKVPMYDPNTDTFTFKDVIYEVPDRIKKQLNSVDYIPIKPWIKRYYVSGAKKFAKSMTSSKLRNIKFTEDDEIGNDIGHNPSDYRKVFDFAWTIW